MGKSTKSHPSVSRYVIQVYKPPVDTRFSGIGVLLTTVLLK